MKYNYKVLILWSMILVSCQGSENNKLMQEFNHILNENNKTSRYKTICHKDGTLKKEVPNDLNHPFKNYIQEVEFNIIKNMAKNIKEDCKDKGQGSIQLNILYRTNSYLNLSSKEGYDYCYAYPVLQYDYLNLIYVNNKLYKIILSNHIKKYIKNIQWGDSECNNASKNVNLEKKLIIKNKQVYMRVYFGKVCSEDIVIEMDNKNFVFTVIE